MIELEENSLEIDLMEIDKDVEYAEKRLKNFNRKECELFLEAIQSTFESEEVPVDFLNNPGKEHSIGLLVWAKQATMDLLCTGRIMAQVIWMLMMQEVKVHVLQVKFNTLV